VIAYIGEYLRRSGGKRVRPALTILSNYAVGGDGSNYSSIRMATVMEFLHTATLVHDDVIDKAETRRNRPSINSEFGNQTAVLMGDWLYMSAFETSLAERSLPILDILTAVTRRMTEGELLQLTLNGRTDVTEEQYFDVIARKTAYLFSACCEIGALVGGADPTTQSLLRDYGMTIHAHDPIADAADTLREHGEVLVGWEELPPSDVLVFKLAGGRRVIMRPSGTEPKLKSYYEVRAEVAAGESIADARGRGLAELASLRDAHQRLLA